MKSKNPNKDVHKRPEKEDLRDDLFVLSGCFEIVVRSAETKEVIKTFSYPNIVVYNTRVQESRLIAGDFLPAPPLNITRYISRIGFGTSGTAETVNDTMLTNALYVNVSGVSYPSPYSVRFSAELAADVGNGIEYREAGLLFQNPAPFLATRKAFPGVVKSSAWVWDVYWTLSFD